MEAQPLDKIVFQKIKYGKNTASRAKITEYDPRAPSDRCIDNNSLKGLQDKLACCLPSSSFFLFYNIQPTGNIQIDSTSESVPEQFIELDELQPDEDMAFNDEYDISCRAFKLMINDYVKTQTATADDIERIEKETHGQSQNEMWYKLKETVLTASNFKDAARRIKEPDILLKNIMYITGNNNKVAAMNYGNMHEQDAVNCYVSVKHKSVHLKVSEVGTKISRSCAGPVWTELYMILCQMIKKVVWK